MPALISVLLPMYNAERFIAEAIDSVTCQSISDVELIIIDDGSTDAGPAIASEKSSSHPSIHILSCNHGGVVAALNKGIAIAQGTYLARLDADDKAHPDRFQVQVDFLDSHPDVAAVGGWVQLIDQTGLDLHRTYTRPTSNSGLLVFMRQNNPLIHSTVMMRADIIRKHGGYRSAFEGAEDYDLWLRVADTHLIDNIPRVLGSLRVHETQVSFRALAQQVLASKFAQHASRARMRGVDEEPWVAGSFLDRLGRMGNTERRKVCRDFLSALRGWQDVLGDGNCWDGFSEWQKDREGCRSMVESQDEEERRIREILRGSLSF